MSHVLYGLEKTMQLDVTKEQRSVSLGSFISLVENRFEEKEKHREVEHNTTEV